jgi:hypothetical protein
MSKKIAKNCQNHDQKASFPKDYMAQLGTSC